LSPTSSSRGRAAPLTLARHRLHGHAQFADLRQRAAHAGQQLAVGVAHAGGVGQIEQHAVHLALVRDAVGIDLERHRKTELGGDQHGLVGRAGAQSLRHRHLEGRQQRLALHLAEQAAALCQHGVHQQARTGQVGRAGQRERIGRLLQLLLVGVPLRHDGEGAHRRLGGAKGRHAGLGQTEARAGIAALAHPAGQQGLAEAGCGTGQGLGHCLWFAGRQGGVQRQHGVDVLARLQRQHRVGELLARVVEFLASGDLEPEPVGGVGRQHQRSAAVAQQRKARALHAPAVARTAQAFGGGHQFHHAVHAHRTGTPQCGVEHRLALRQLGAVSAHGVAGVGRRARLPAALEHQHRLGGGGQAQRAHEAARVGDVLDVQQDGLGAAAARQIEQQLGHVDRRMRPDRHQLRKAQAVAQTPVEHGGRQRTRLRDQGQGPRLGQRTEQAGVQAQGRVLQAQGVGTQQVQALALCQFAQHGHLGGRHAAAQRQHGTAAHAAGQFHALAQRRRRQRQHRQVGARGRQLGQRAAALHVGDRELAVKALRLEGLEQALGLAAALPRGVGQDDQRAGGEQRFERVGVHGGPIEPARAGAPRRCAPAHSAHSRPPAARPRGPGRWRAPARGCAGSARRSPTRPNPDCPSRPRGARRNRRSPR
jgi:hypothetical protein